MSGSTYPVGPKARELCHDMWHVIMACKPLAVAMQLNLLCLFGLYDIVVN